MDSMEDPWDLLEILGDRLAIQAGHSAHSPVVIHSEVPLPVIRSVASRVVRVGSLGAILSVAVSPVVEAFMAVAVDN